LNQFVNVRLRAKRLTINSRGKKRTIKTFQGATYVDDENMRLAGKLDGFWLAVTNHTEKEQGKFEKPAEEIIGPYRQKTIIEAGFRDIKSFIQVEPVYVWTIAHVKGHYTVCVLAYLMDRTLTLRLHKNPGLLTIDVVTHEKLYEKLSDCQVDRIEVVKIDHSVTSLTRSTKVQEELLKRIELKSLLNFKPPE
jgi:transposase